MNDDQDEKVGPGHPPRKNRFQKGKSGNPRGRPKGKLNINTIDNYYYKAFFEDSITINSKDGPQRASAFGAMLMVLKKKALNGDSAAIEKILDRCERRAAAAPQPSSDADRLENDEAVLRRFMRLGPARPVDSEPPNSVAEDEEGDDG